MNNMKLVSPYKNVQQIEPITIEPYQMNSDIRNSMKINLKKKVEKKCNDEGFVDQVNRIINYSDGQLLAENFLASAKYYVRYQCRLCIPIEKTIIVAQIKIVNKEIIFASHGPCIIFIPIEYVDTSVWDTTNEYTHRVQNIKLNIADYIKIEVINKRINENDTQIKVIGKLLDFANTDEVKEFFNNNVAFDESDFINEEKETNFI